MHWGLTIHNSKGNSGLRGGHVREFTFEVCGYYVFSVFHGWNSVVQPRKWFINKIVCVENLIYVTKVFALRT